jgi:acyl carrier protein
MDIKKIEGLLIKEVAVILEEDVSNINAEKTLVELGIDSLSFVELLVAIEKNFGVKLMESGLTKEDFRTLGTLARRIAVK